MFGIHIRKRQILDEIHEFERRNVPVSIIKVETRCSLLGNHFHNKLSGLVCHDFPLIILPVTCPPLIHTLFLSFKLLFADCSCLFCPCSVSRPHILTCCNVDPFYLGLLALIRLQLALEKAIIINTD